MMTLLLYCTAVRMSELADDDDTATGSRPPLFSARVRTQHAFQDTAVQTVLIATWD